MAEPCHGLATLAGSAFSLRATVISHLEEQGFFWPCWAEECTGLGGCHAMLCVLTVFRDCHRSHRYLGVHWQWHAPTGLNGVVP